MTQEDAARMYESAVIEGNLTQMVARGEMHPSDAWKIRRALLPQYQLSTNGESAGNNE